MNSLLGTALDGPQTAMMNMSRLQNNSGGSLLGACPQPIMDDQQQLQYAQQLSMSSQSQRYPQTLPSLMTDVMWNTGNVNDFRSSSLLGSLRNESYTNPRGNSNSLASSSSILGSVNAVQDTFHLQAQNLLNRPGPGGIPSLLGPIQPLPTPQRYPRNEVQNVASGGITSLLGSVTSNVNEEPQQLKSRIPSLVEAAIAQRGMEGTKSHGFTGASSILGSAMTEREARTNIEQVRTSNQTPSTIPSLLGLSSLPLMSGHQGNLRGMGQNQRTGQKNPISLLADDMDMGLENRNTMQPQGMNEDRMFSGGQQQMQQMQQMQQQMQQQMREPHLQQQHQQTHQQSVHMESQMRGSGAGYSVAPGGYSMGTSGIAGDNSMTGDTYGNAYSMSGNGYSVEANNAYSMAPSSAYSMEPNSTYSIAPSSGYSMTPSNAYSMSANGVYSMDNNAHNIAPGGGSSMNVQESMCSVLMMNLPVHMGPDELKSTLYSYCISGPPADVQVPWAGVARLIFNDAQSAVAIVNQMDGQNLNGHVLRVYVESYNIDQQRME